MSTKAELITDLESIAVILREWAMTEGQGVSVYQYKIIVPVPWDSYGLVIDDTKLRVSDEGQAGESAVWDEPYLPPIVKGLVDWWDINRNDDKTLLSNVQWLSSSQCAFQVADRSTNEIVITDYSGSWNGSSLTVALAF